MILGILAVSVYCAAVSAIANDLPKRVLKKALQEFPFYTGQVLPVPQEVKYFDEFADISNTVLIPGKDIRDNDPRLKLLKQRIEFLGGKVSIAKTPPGKGALPIYVGGQESFPGVKIPGKAEGYAIHWEFRQGRPCVFLKGKDLFGVLWAVTSLNQLMFKRNGKAFLRKAEIFDWPEYPDRGFMSGIYSGQPTKAAVLLLYGKLKTLCFLYQYGFYCTSKEARRLRTKKTPNPSLSYPPSKEWLENVRRFGEMLTPLGVTWYVGFHPIRGKADQKIDCGSDKDFQAIMKYIEPIARAGGGFYLMFDDVRFPLHPNDRKRFGSARAADVYLINRIYNTVRKKYPGFKIVVVPPFYWGPKYHPAYGEDRDKYLYAIGKELPKDIDICWTGRSVWGGKVKKEEVEWITERIKRRPWYFQNATGVNTMHGYHYMTDPIDIWTWYYDGFYRDVKLYAPCGKINISAYVLTLGAYTWNPGSYHPARTVREAVDMLVGPENWESQCKANQAMKRLDRWRFNVSSGAIKHLPEIEKNTAKLGKAWKQCLKHHPDSVMVWSPFYKLYHRSVIFLKKLKLAAKKMKTVSPEIIGKIRKNAKTEARFDPAKDFLFTPYDFFGGFEPLVYRFKQKDPRICTFIRKSNTPYHRMKISFITRIPPAKENYDLIICGQDDDADEKCRVRILVNGNQVFEGGNPFVKFRWTPHVFKVKGDYLKEGENTIVIENVDKSGALGKGPPFFLLHYAVLKDFKASGGECQ